MASAFPRLPPLSSQSASPQRPPGSCILDRLPGCVSSIHFIGQETGAPSEAEALALEVKITSDSPEPSRQTWFCHLGQAAP